MGKSSEELLLRIREGKDFTLVEQVRLVWQLSYPVMLSQLAFVLMRFTDTAMIGSLGANKSASIGLVESTMWLFGGITAQTSAGFCVLVSHFLGANRGGDARNVLRQSFVVLGLFGLCISLIGVSISPYLPQWLGASTELHRDATSYFLIFALTLPIMQINSLCVGMLKSSGEVKIPSILSVVMCVLNVLFNFLFIYPSRTLSIGGMEFRMWGAGLDVRGVALGTTLASFISTLLMIYFLCIRSKDLSLCIDKGAFLPTKEIVKRALNISIPMCIQHLMICPAQILITAIIAPMGAYAIAANSFGIAIEAICYMPGFGVREAATTLVGQSLGAERIDLMKRFAYISVVLGMLVMTFMGGIMYFSAQTFFSILTPVEEIRKIGTEVLRIEAFVEPFFGASIVCFGVFVGVGSTFIPMLMHLFSNWGVRVTLVFLLAPILGLKGAWIGMALELCFRGIIFLIRLFGKGWIREAERRKYK